MTQTLTIIKQIYRALDQAEAAAEPGAYTLIGLIAEARIMLVELRRHIVAEASAVRVMERR